MKDLGGRFGQSDERGRAEARPDPLTRLQQATAEDVQGHENFAPLPRSRLHGRIDLLATLFASLAAVLLIWPLARPATLQLPAVAETGDEVASLTVRPLLESGVASPPDWYGLFNAYQLETGLRDISIRCNYGLPVDARVDRYLHTHLPLGAEIRIFLADPGKCPKP